MNVIAKISGRVEVPMPFASGGPVSALCTAAAEICAVRDFTAVLIKMHEGKAEDEYLQAGIHRLATEISVHAEEAEAAIGEADKILRLRLSESEQLSEVDPLFAAIARHRRAHAKFMATPEDNQAAEHAAGKIENAAWAELLRTPPSSTGGLIALVEYALRVKNSDCECFNARVGEDAVGDLLRSVLRFAKSRKVGAVELQDVARDS